MRTGAFALAMLCASSVAASEWYQGGTLHGATVAEWQSATNANRLATSGDFVAGLWRDDRLSVSVSGIDDVRVYAGELSTCVTDSTIDIPEIAHLKITEFAVVCMSLMGWLK